jgi:hypothetical protein
MANDFFNVSGNPLDHTTGVSSVIRAEFAAIAAGFTALQVTPNLGAPTGTTAAPGDSSTKLATTAFVAATAFSSALPGQTSNSGKYLTTNGTTASWVFIGGGATSHSSAVDVTLTDELTHIHPCNFSVTDKSVILPDATTLTVGCAYTFTKTGLYDFAVRDSTGRYLTNVAILETHTLTLSDKSTAAGVWIHNRSDIAGLSSGPEYAINGVSSIVPFVIPVSSTVAVVLYCGATNFMNAIVVTATANSDDLTYGGNNVVNAINPSNQLFGVALSPTKLLVTFRGVSGFVNAVCLTVSGNTVTANTNYVLNAIVSAPFWICMLSSTQAIVTFYNATFIACVATLNVSGFVITIGTTLVIGAAACGNIMISTISSTTAVVTYSETTTGKVQIITVSGTTCSAGSAATFTVTANGNPGVLFLGGSSFVVAYNNANVYLNFYTFSGTTISADNTNNQVSSNGGVLAPINLVLLDAASPWGVRFLVGYKDSDATLMSAIIWYLTGYGIHTGDTHHISWSSVSSPNFAALSANKAIAVYIASTFVTACLVEYTAVSK